MVTRVGDATAAVTRPAGYTDAPTLDAVRDGDALIRSGQAGPDVQRIQQVLIEGGHYEGLPGGARDGEADGVFGTRTAAALRSYQQANGLQVDGVFGTESYGAMFGARAPADTLETGPGQGDVGEFVRNQTGTEAGGDLTAGDLARQDEARLAPRPDAAGVDDAARPTTAGQDGVHERFAGDATLERVAAGQEVLRPGATGDHVTRVQNALIDLGFDIPTDGASGTYDQETANAVRRFQRERGLSVDGVVGQNTLGALNEVAPPAGQRLERMPEYDRLYADNRLDTTIAVGYDEHGTTDRTTRRIVSGLRAEGYRPIDPSTMSADERARLGLTEDRYDPNADYFHRTFERDGQQIDGVVRLITPGDTARASFEQAMAQDEVVIYSGHARYGTGPDFDHRSSGDGNFVIDGAAPRAPGDIRGSIAGEGNRLDDVEGRPDYQLLVFNACSTEDYLDNLRDPSLFAGRNRDNTDIITTTIPTRLATNGDHAVRFLTGIEDGESMTTMLGDQNRIEGDMLRRFELEEWYDRARHTYTESGFLDNTGNRYVDK